MVRKVTSAEKAITQMDWGQTITLSGLSVKGKTPYGSQLGAREVLIGWNARQSATPI
jgi:hypothetical protein